MSQRRARINPASRPRVTFPVDSGMAYDNSGLAENIPPQDSDRPMKCSRKCDDVSFAGMFEKKWNSGRSSRYNIAAPPEPVDANFSDDDIDMLVAGATREPVKEQRPTLSTQTPESVLRDIDQLVDRVHEICGRRLQ